MIITFIFMATTLFATYVAYRQATKAQELDQAVYEKTGIIAHLKDHVKSITSKLETCEYDLQHTKNIIVDLRRNIDELERKTKSKPKQVNSKKDQPAVKSAEPKKRKYNKRKF